MFCETCGVHAETRHVAMYQNIGLLVMRMQSGVDGNLCKRCIHKYFWQHTLVNLFFGWWGIISLFVNAFFLINNTVRYLAALGMQPPDAGAVPPQLDEAAVDRLDPHLDYLLERLNQGEEFGAVTQDVAMRAGVSPAQVALYVQALHAAAQAQQHQSGNLG